MSVQENLQALNRLIGQGQIIDAVDQFFHDDIRTQEVGQDALQGKAPKRAGLSEFVNNISAVREITVLDNAIHGNTSYSEYTFRFDFKDGSQVDWHEIISRKWAGDKIVEERYFQN